MSENRTIANIPQQPQTQAALNDQLMDLYTAAVKLGLYDAADWIVRWRNESRLPTIAQSLAEMSDD